MANGTYGYGSWEHEQALLQAEQDNERWSAYSSNPMWGLTAREQAAILGYDYDNAEDALQAVERAIRQEKRTRKPCKRCAGTLGAHETDCPKALRDAMRRQRVVDEIPF